MLFLLFLSHIGVFAKYYEHKLNQPWFIFCPLTDEIAGVQRATVQFIEDAAADDNRDFRYVLVPFNDPGEHLGLTCMS